MTSITSVLSNRYFQYQTSRSTSSVNDDSASLIPAAGSSPDAGTSSSSDDQSQISAAQQLIAQLMNVILTLQSGSGGGDADSSSANSDGDSAGSTSSSQSVAAANSQRSKQADLIKAMDTNGDGDISEAEFVAARPASVSADQASKLFESFDKDKTGSLTEEQLAKAMKAGHHMHHGGRTGDEELSKAFSSMDTDGDGNVTEAEFVAARPSDMGADQATALFGSLDTSGSGSLTQSQFEAAVKAQRPQPAELGNLYASDTQDQTTTDLLTL
ncbi:EF-hand domain-containing protein [Rhizobium lusitanum]|uniref:Ca2+-binding EF-hand superfamily protein n=1 Tax=Rhizobium lusitanum TaxID=293958 RepID=A0A7X0ITS1_9HYPH|nr:EF-hand domain-containing protein [Rhizobium lusitanum]MBB6486628.1 Ca2+-binding EF-hand superfamily protein [Rhizobium lusitanum]